MDFDASRFVMRARRIADLSQRDLASLLGISHSLVAQFETGARAPSLDMFCRILAVAGLRQQVVDAAGAEVAPTPADPIRDNGNRRLPVHLDVANRAPWWTFNHPHYDRPHAVAHYLMRPARDEQRAVDGVEPDQQTATELWAERAAAAARRAAERRARALAAEPVPDCECLLECHESGPCVTACECQCEPPGRRSRLVG